MRGPAPGWHLASPRAAATHPPLMGLLALGHLVAGQHTPRARAAPRAACARSHDPTTTMEGFAVAASMHGRLKLRIEGDRAPPSRHRPLEIDRGAPRSARRPRDRGAAGPRDAHGDGSEVQLIGGAVVRRRQRRRRRTAAVPRRVPARLRQHRARALAPAGGGGAREGSDPRRRHGLLTPPGARLELRADHARAAAGAAHPRETRAP